MILGVALYFAHVTALQTSAFSIGFGSMQRDLGMTDLQAATGVSLYGWVSHRLSLIGTDCSWIKIRGSMLSSMIVNQGDRASLSDHYV